MATTTETKTHAMLMSECASAGAHANADGLPRIAALDPALMALLPVDEPVGGVFRSMVHAWHDGYRIEGLNRLAAEVFG